MLFKFLEIFIDMKLFVFGCSNSALYHTETLEYQQYKEFRMDNFPPTWSELLSKKLNCDLHNCAIPGCGNDSIMMELIKNIININEGDIIIIGWTFIERYMWVNTMTNVWNHHSHPYTKNMDITINTHQEIILHRSLNSSYHLIVDQIYEWMDMINYIATKFNFGVYYWSCDNRVLPQHNTHINNRNQSKFWDNLLIREKKSQCSIFEYVKKNGGQKIIEETGGLIEDHHWGESGHKVLSELFYDGIFRKTKLI